MSDGGWEGGRVDEPPNISNKYDGEDFTQEIAKITVAKICESKGFQTFQQTALERLSDIAIRYVHNLGMTAHIYANYSGRIECNAFDIIDWLEYLGSTQGFLSASDVERCLADSVAIREIAQYVVKADKIPFTYSIPKFPIVIDRNGTPSFSQLGEEPPVEHIPSWLPAFPYCLSCIQSPTCSNVVTELHMTRIEQEKQKKAERPSFNLQWWLAGKGIEGSFSAEPNSIQPKQAACNPFLAAPLEIGDKEVPPLLFPTKLLEKPRLENHVMENLLTDSHVSAWETFTPAIESMKNNHSISQNRCC